MINLHTTKFRVSALLIAALGLMLLLQALYVTPRIKNDRMEGATHAQEMLAAQIVDSIQFSFRQAIAELESIARLPGIVSMEKGRLDETIGEMDDVTQFFNYYFVLDTGGRWVSYPSRPSLVGDRIPGHNMHWVTETFEQDRTISLDVVVTKIGTLVSGFSTPIRSETGEPVGLLRGVIVVSQENTILNTIADARIGERGYAYVVASNGWLIAHPQITLDPQDFTVHDYTAYAPIDSVMGGETGLVEYQYADETWVAAYRPVEPTGWGVIVHQPKADIVARANREARILSRFFAATFLLTVLMLVPAIQFSLKPLTQLIGDISSGHLSPGENYRKDEIGQLAREFNTLYADLFRSRQALGQSEARLRAIFEAAENVGFIMIDPAGPDSPILEFSPGAERIFGYERDQIIGQPVATLHRPEDRGRIPQALEAMRQGEPGFTGESMLVRKSGKVFPAIYTTHPIFDARESMTAAIGVAVDISDRQQAEEALRRSLEETAHSQRLLLALSQRVQAVQRARTPEAVYRAIGEQLVRLGFDATACTVSDDGTHLIVSHLTLSSDRVRAAEELTGLSAEGYRIPMRPGGTFHEIITRQEPVFSPLDDTVLAQALPQSVRPLAERLVDLLGWQQCVIVPLVIGGEAHGLLIVTGDDLTESDVPAITAFANQATIALENAELYREIQHLAAFNESIIQRMAEGIVVDDANGKLTFVNPAAAEMLGYTPDELTGLPWTAIIPPDQRAITETANERRRHGQADRYELELLHKDGRRVSALVAGSPRFEDGQFAGTLAVFTDIRELKQTEEALRRSEQFLTDVFGAIQDGISVLDRDLTVVQTNRWIREMHADHAPLIGKKCYTVYQLRSSPCPWCPSLPALETGEQHTTIVPYPSMEKPTGWMELTAFPLKNDDGQVVGIIEYVKDITDRKQAEDQLERLNIQLREEARRVQQIIVTVPEGVLLLDAGGRILLANPAAERVLTDLVGPEAIPSGEPITTLGDRPLAELLTSPPQRGMWHEVRAGGRTFEIIARPMENGHQPENWVLVIKDATQEREARERLQQQGRLAAVGQLAAGIAHDFNNILATIVLYAQISLQSEEVSPRIQKRLQTIDQQAHHATRLIEQILDFSRRAVLARQPLDLLLLLKGEVELLERTLPEHIEVKLVYGQDEYVTMADPTRIQQMVTNLALNARDAMDQGGTLRIGLDRVEVTPGEPPPLPEMAAGSWIRLTVSDTGTGISPDVLPHVFEPFFTTKQAGIGSGLGLAQVYGIVGQHEGYIAVETQVGEGTTFTVYLTALPDPPAAPPVLAPSTVPRGQGQTILVVEDEASVRNALVEGLQQLNYRVLEAVDGQDALQKLEQHQVALVLSDVVMPRMGGIPLFHALRKKGVTIPIVLLTGHPMEKELENLQTEGLSAWLSKPPSLDQLGRVLAQVLDERPT